MKKTDYSTNSAIHKEPLITEKITLHELRQMMASSTNGFKDSPKMGVLRKDPQYELIAEVRTSSGVRMEAYTQGFIIYQESVLHHTIMRIDEDIPETYEYPHSPRETVDIEYIDWTIGVTLFGEDHIEKNQQVKMSKTKNGNVVVKPVLGDDGEEYSPNDINSTDHCNLDFASHLNTEKAAMLHILVQDVLSDLTDLQWDSLYLNYVYGLTDKEIANMRGCSVSTIANSRARAVSKLSPSLKVAFDLINDSRKAKEGECEKERKKKDSPQQ